MVVDLGTLLSSSVQTPHLPPPVPHTPGFLWEERPEKSCKVSEPGPSSEQQQFRGSGVPHSTRCLVCLGAARGQDPLAEEGRVGVFNHLSFCQSYNIEVERTFD